MERGTTIAGLTLVLLIAGAGTASAVCTVRATPISFGPYNGLAVISTTTVGTVTYRCSGALPAGLKILLQQGRAGNVRKREMLAGKERLFYRLSLDPIGAALWGDGTRGTQFYFDPHPPTGQAVTIYVYGHLLAGQKVSAGAIYHDLVPVLSIY